MTYRFSNFSKANLGTCDPDLQRLFNEVIKHTDCRIIEGHRGEARQNLMFDTGKSKLEWPNGKHNSRPSRAVDAVPWPVDWQDRERMTYFAGIVQGIGLAMTPPVRVRWGGNWDGDGQLSDNSFDDLAHFELV